MRARVPYFWKKIPIVRLLIPFITGILLQWYIGVPIAWQAAVLFACVAVFIFFMFLPTRFIFKMGWIYGVCVMLAFCMGGAFVAYKNDLTNNDLWAGNFYKDSAVVLVTIEEPLVEKQRSYKALASIEAINLDNEWQPVKSKVLLYFKKTGVKPALQYGDQIIFANALQTIANAGNPGSFNYKRYSAFNDTYYQCFLQQGQYRKTGGTSVNPLKKWLFALRSSVIKTLQTYIHADREKGVAEALLIGYRDDLDKNLVQAYSNTGVVHIIAISGLHLGLIYGTLFWLFSLFKKRRWVGWVKPIVILLVLWIFSLVAGAAPSILRSAIMFTFLLAGEVINRKQSKYNTLAASAFTILLYDPFALWNVGFQLSYAAVLSIMLFMQPIYKLVYLKSKALKWVWKLNAVTLSAQVLTIPIVCYHFHQFPNLFLLTNFVVVPLSGFILYGEMILLAAAALFEPLAQLAGFITENMLRFMNSFIIEMDQFTFSVTDGIQISILQTILLFVTLIAVSFWLMYKNRTAFYLAFTNMLFFVLSFSADVYERSVQSKLIVYNIPRHTAIDFIEGRHYQFAGDTALLNDDFLLNFHLKPSRVLHRIAEAQIRDAAAAYPFYFYRGQRILLVDKPFKFTSNKPMAVDVVILSKNAGVSLLQLSRSFYIRLVVMDGSNSIWRMERWKKECDSLHLRHYSTQDSGALELSL